MKLFSERMGYARGVAQVESMDLALRNRIWNVMELFFWRSMREGRFGIVDPNTGVLFFEKLWDNFFKWSLETMPGSNTRRIEAVKNKYDTFRWHEVYDFIDYMARQVSKGSEKELIRVLNVVLKEELSGYRIVGKRSGPIVDKAEIDEIEEALKKSPGNVRIHIEAAIELISDKGKSDINKYRNCIKESISAVEALCNQILGKKCPSLSHCLKKLESQKKIPLHEALSKSLQSLYGWTSDDEGIRHPLMEEPSLTLEDARFMLITCSAFTNYLLSKASQAGIEL